jgi:hypothetical protein
MDAADPIRALPAVRVVTLPASVAAAIGPNWLFWAGWVTGCRGLCLPPTKITWGRV